MSTLATGKLRLPPERTLRCLLIHPRFAEAGYWNHAELCQLMGAKASAAPLGLLTVAAILPQHWEFRLVDCNIRDVTAEEWQWADLVCIGGKQPQQKHHLELVSEAKRRGKFVVVGGPNPSAQHELFAEADCLISGEAENTVPLWLEAWRSGTPAGVFQADEKPDLTQSPIPRFDLIRPQDYLQLSVQYSRGCPYRCDFCDIAGQFGRARRVKTADQVLAELQCIYELGYRGPIDIADDNFVCDRRALKEEFLPALIAWSRERHHPFWFTTELSIDVAGDLETVRLLREADFRLVFIGIETADKALLASASKKQNLGSSIEERVRVLQRHGICVTAGFIVGFDQEQAGVDRAMIEFIQQTNICLARAALLLALPGTSLTQRLVQEGRMRPEDARLSYDAKQLYDTGFAGEEDIVDQTSLGLNFATARDKQEILEEFKNIIDTLYRPEQYMSRVRGAARLLRGGQKHQPGPRMLLRYLRAFWRLSLSMTRNPATRWHYWRTVLSIVPLGVGAIDHSFRLLGFYLHLQEYRRLAIDFIQRRQICERVSQAAIPDADDNTKALQTAQRRAVRPLECRAKERPGEVVKSPSVLV